MKSIQEKPYQELIIYVVAQNCKNFYSRSEAWDNSATFGLYHIYKIWKRK